MLANVSRTSIHREEGSWFCIELAVRADLTCPVQEYLDLPEDSLPADDRATDDSIDRRAGNRQRFLASLRWLGRTGEIPRGLWYNVLEDGIWEFKPANIRITFYDTDGLGGHEPKRAERSIVTKQVDWPSDLEEYLRLTTWFPKTTQKTPPGEIYKAKRVREEDLEHDRKTTSIDY